MTIMRVLLCFAFLVLAISFWKHIATQETTPMARKGPPPIVYPDKDLEEIFVSGYYRPENPDYAKELEEEYYRRGPRDESFESYLKKRPYLLNRGKERFHPNPVKMYCYDKIKEEEKHPIDEKFIARLYAETGEALNEVFLRLTSSFETPFKHSSFDIYLPYHQEASYIKIFILKGNKKVSLARIAVYSQSDLRRNSRRYNSIYKGISKYLYNEKKQCHVFDSHKL